jgi:hypothetical protein
MGDAMGIVNSDGPDAFPGVTAWKPFTMVQYDMKDLSEILGEKYPGQRILDVQVNRRNGVVLFVLENKVEGEGRS